jgi:hypothetical protein
MTDWRIIDLAAKRLLSPRWHAKYEKHSAHQRELEEMQEMYATVPGSVSEKELIVIRAALSLVKNKITKYEPKINQLMEELMAFYASYPDAERDLLAFEEKHAATVQRLRRFAVEEIPSKLR